MKKIPVIIDTDLAFGSNRSEIDDAVALALAFAQPSWDIIGVTAVGGNVPAAIASQNVDKFLKRLGKSDIPHSWSTRLPLDPSLWVRVRWKELEQEAPTEIPEGFISPELLLYRLIMESSEPVTLVPIGSLTNIALLLRTYPSCIPHIKEILMMGGSWRMPGAKGLAEFNILVDPESARIVFDSPLHITMFGLDVTKKQPVYPDDIVLWKEIPSSFIRDIYTNAVAFMQARAMRDGYATPYSFFHDGMPVMASSHPEFFTFRDCTITVDTEGTYTRGMTIVDFKDRSASGFKHRIAIDVDATSYLSTVLETISNAWGAIK